MKRLAYVKWAVRAIFVPGEDGEPRLLDNGVCTGSIPYLIARWPQERNIPHTRLIRC